LTTTPILLDVAEKIAQDWREIGVTTSVQVASTIPPDYQAFLAIYDIPNDPDQYATWHSSQTATNISHYANPRIDKLLEEGRLELDKEKRREIYLDFQRFLLEDAPAIFLYHPITYTITRK
jgi:ABC-type transport system substrate-binding protein